MNNVWKIYWWSRKEAVGGKHDDNWLHQGRNGQGGSNRVLSRTHYQINAARSGMITWKGSWETKVKNEEWTWSLGGVPSAAPRTHQWEASPFDRDLDDCEIWGRLKLRRHNYFTTVPVSWYSHTVESIHSTKTEQHLGIRLSWKFWKS